MNKHGNATVSQTPRETYQKTMPWVPSCATQDQENFTGSWYFPSAIIRLIDQINGGHLNI